MGLTYDHDHPSDRAKRVRISEYDYRFRPSEQSGSENAESDESPSPISNQVNGPSSSAVAIRNRIRERIRARQQSRSSNLTLSGGASDMMPLSADSPRFPIPTPLYNRSNEFSLVAQQHSGDHELDAHEARQSHAHDDTESTSSRDRFGRSSSLYLQAAIPNNEQSTSLNYDDRLARMLVDARNSRLQDDDQSMNFITRYGIDLSLPPPPPIPASEAPIVDVPSPVPQRNLPTDTSVRQHGRAAGLLARTSSIHRSSNAGVRWAANLPTDSETDEISPQARRAGRNRFNRPYIRYTNPQIPLQDGNNNIESTANRGIRSPMTANNEGYVAHLEEQDIDQNKDNSLISEHIGGVSSEAPTRDMLDDQNAVSIRDSSLELSPDRHTEEPLRNGSPPRARERSVAIRRGLPTTAVFDAGSNNRDSRTYYVYADRVVQEADGRDSTNSFSWLRHPRQSIHRSIVNGSFSNYVIDSNEEFENSAVSRVAESDSNKEDGHRPLPPTVVEKLKEESMRKYGVALPSGIVYRNKDDDLEVEDRDVEKGENEKKGYE